jgi:hypothetical protein
MIEGTSIKLDTPEAIEAWIAERKAKWPTQKVIQDKVSLVSSFLRLQLTIRVGRQVDTKANTCPTCSRAAACKENQVAEASQTSAQTSFHG